MDLVSLCLLEVSEQWQDLFSWDNGQRNVHNIHKKQDVLTETFCQHNSGFFMCWNEKSFEKLTLHVCIETAQTVTLGCTLFLLDAKCNPRLVSSFCFVLVASLQLHIQDCYIYYRILGRHFSNDWTIVLRKTFQCELPGRSKSPEMIYFKLHHTILFIRMDSSSRNKKMTEFCTNPSPNCRIFTE